MRNRRKYKKRKNNGLLFVTVAVLLAVGGVSFYWEKVPTVSVPGSISYYWEQFVTLDERGGLLGWVHNATVTLRNETKEMVEQQEVVLTGEVILTIGVLSDSHGSDRNMTKAVNQMKSEDIDYIIHLGDFTSGGEEDQFSNAFSILNKSGIPFVVLPGDHDFNWYPEHSRANYEAVFGKSYDQVVDLLDDKVRIVLFDNSIVSFEQSEKQAFISDLISASGEADVVTIFFSPRPLFNSYFTSKSDGEGERIAEKLKLAGIHDAFAGNTHIYSEYTDSLGEMSYVTVGAVGEYKNPLPQWVFVEVYDSGEIDVRPIPLLDVE